MRMRWWLSDTIEWNRQQRSRERAGGLGEGSWSGRGVAGHASQGSCQEWPQSECLESGLSHTLQMPAGGRTYRVSYLFHKLLNSTYSVWWGSSHLYAEGTLVCSFLMKSLSGLGLVTGELGRTPPYSLLQKRSLRLDTIGSINLWLNLPVTPSRPKVFFVGRF